MKIQFKIFLAMTSVIIVVVSLFALVYFSYIRLMLAEDRYNLLQEVAESAQHETNNFLREGYSDAVSLSKSSILQSENAPSDQQLQLLEMVSSTHGGYEDISLIGTDGKVMLSTSFSFRGNWEEKSWFVEARKGKQVVSNAHYQIGSGEVVVEFLSPVLGDDGQVKSIVSITRPLSILAGKLERPSNTSEVFIVNRFNMFVVHPDAEKVLSSPDERIPFSRMGGDRGVVEYVDDAGATVVAAYTLASPLLDVGETSWKVMAVEEKRSLMRLVIDSQRLLTLISSFILVTIFIIIILLSKSIITPVSRLKEGVEHISKGDFDSKVELSSHDEFEDLAEAFDRMRIEVKNSREHLALEVQKRTKQLTEKLDILERFRKVAVAREFRIKELEKENAEMKSHKGSVAAAGSKLPAGRVHAKKSRGGAQKHEGAGERKQGM